MRRFGRMARCVSTHFALKVDKKRLGGCWSRVVDREVEGVDPVKRRKHLSARSLPGRWMFGRGSIIDDEHITIARDVKRLVLPHAFFAQITQDIERVGLRLHGDMVLTSWVSVCGTRRERLCSNVLP